MSDEIRPALSAEEWCDLRHNDEQLIAYASWWGLVHESRGNWEHGNIAELVEPKDISRHALAALCLYQQPFGFTQEDVDALRGVADLGDRKATDLASLPYAYSDLARRAVSPFALPGQSAQKGGGAE